MFIFVGDQVDAEREFVNVCTLSAEIEDTNLGVCKNCRSAFVISSFGEMEGIEVERTRYTTVESGLWVWL